MPPTHDQLDADKRCILAATLAACRGKNFSAQACAALPMVPKKGGFVTFNAEILKERKSTIEYGLRERMEEWLDEFIAANVLARDTTLYVHVCKDLVGAGMPGISVILWHSMT